MITDAEISAIRNRLDDEVYIEMAVNEIAPKILRDIARKGRMVSQDEARCRIKAVLKEIRERMIVIERFRPAIVAPVKCLSYGDKAVLEAFGCGSVGELIARMELEIAGLKRVIGRLAYLLPFMMREEIRAYLAGDIDIRQIIRSYADVDDIQVRIDKWDNGGMDFSPEKNAFVEHPKRCR